MLKSRHISFLFFSVCVGKQGHCSAHVFLMYGYYPLHNPLLLLLIYLTIESKCLCLQFVLFAEISSETSFQLLHIIQGRAGVFLKTNSIMCKNHKPGNPGWTSITVLFVNVYNVSMGKCESSPNGPLCFITCCSFHFDH